MRELWTELVGRDDTAAQAIYAIIESLYDRTGYHTLTHIRECLNLLQTIREDSPRDRAFEFAIWFHDAIYIPGDKANERRSAALAEVILKGLGEAAFVERTMRLILATEHETGREIGPDEALMVDIDLAILGANIIRYDEYARQVRVEFAEYDSAEYTQGRLAFLKSMLDRPAIYTTSEMHIRFEQLARANLQREIGMLEPTMQ